MTRIETTPDQPLSPLLNTLYFLLPVIIPVTQLATAWALFPYFGKHWSDPISEFVCCQYIAGCVVALYVARRARTLRLRTAGVRYSSGALVLCWILPVIMYLCQLGRLILP